MDQKNLGNHIWNVAELLRGDFRQSEYGLIILPFTVLRRFECVLEPTRDAVRQKMEEIAELGIDPDLVLPEVSGQQFYNTSRYQLDNLGVADTLANLEDYINKFSANARAVFEQFEFSNKLLRLDEDKLLYKVAQYFAGIDLHPDVVSNHEMGLAFEHLIRTFAESANDTAGEFYTPRDVVHLATTLVFAHDKEALTGEGVIRTIYDPACGTGGFLSEGMELIEKWNPDARVVPYGQELNAQTHAIAIADMMIKGKNAANIKLGNTLSDDQLYADRFDYCLANPPFGVDWKKVQEDVKAEADKGARGRFGPGLPRVSDGSLLFLMHLISKMRTDGPSRIGIVLNGSPLFTGGAGSGESEIRRWILENDWLEAIVALPTDMFYNTGIATYIWLLSNRKDAHRKGKVQLINASDKKAENERFWQSMRKSLGSKRRFLPDESIADIANLYAAFEQSEHCKIFETTDFGYRRITVERPLQLRFDLSEEKVAALVQEVLDKETKAAEKLAKKTGNPVPDFVVPPLYSMLEKMADGQSFYDREEFFSHIENSHVQKLSAAERKLIQKHLGEHDGKAEYCRDKKGNMEPNPDLRDNENVPLLQDVDTHFQREVIPHVPDAWIDRGKTDEKDGQVGIVAYEIPFNRHFYKYAPPRSLKEIDGDLDKVSAEIMDLLAEVHV